MTATRDTFEALLQTHEQITKAATEFLEAVDEVGDGLDAAEGGLENSMEWMAIKDSLAMYYGYACWEERQ